MSQDPWASAMDRLLAGFAHDANGRATALRGVALLSQMDEPAETWLPLLDAEAARLERLAAGLSALRAEAPEPLDLHDVARTAADTLTAVHVELRLEARPGADVSVRESRGLVVRVLVTLCLQLAPDYTGVTLQARVSRADGRVELEVWGESMEAVVLPAVPLTDARLTTRPGGYRLSLPALAG